MGQSVEHLTLAEAVAKALSNCGADVLAQPRALIGFLMDYMDSDSVELCVLERNCDDDLLRPYRDTIAGTSDLGTAAARAEDYLTRRCRIGASDARLVARGIADGIARWAGVASSVDEPDGADSDAPGATTGDAEDLEVEEPWIGRQVPRPPKKGGAKLLVAALACTALALVLVVYLGRAGGSSANPKSVQVPVSEDVAEADSDSPEGDVIAEESDSETVEEEQEDEETSADETTEDEAQHGVVADPRVVEDSSMEAGQRTTWDCVWLGSYPQSFVTDAATVSALDTATGWSASGDLTYGGATYRRLREEDATLSSTLSFCWDWSHASSAGYCYFLWEPVKWRVLEAEGSTALVVADVALDDQRYHGTHTDVTWETCGLRAWLGQTFRDDALTPVQQGAVVPQDLANDDNISYGTPGGATTDDVFLLSESDVWSADGAARHGFAKAGDTYDEARRCKPSDYARAMGALTSTSSSYLGNCWWWLRSPGDDADCAARVFNNGGVDRYGYDVDYNGDAVRPALRISLSSNQISYAGTVCSDGTVDEVAPGTSEE